MVRAADLVYRALYRGLFSRLPERMAVALGQWGLRHLPLDRLTVFRRDDPRLCVSLGGITLANPLILSSMYYDTAILRRAMGLGFGAVTAKSITGSPRPGHPHPNLVRIETAEGPGLVNCNGFKNPGLEAYRRALAALPHRVPLIVAAAGESADEYARVVAGLEAFGALVEINISSPNTKLVYEWSSRPAELGALFRAVRAATAKPIIVKVSPDFRDVNEERIIPAALDAGITIVNCGNTRRVDEPRLSQRTGGLSGPACSGPPSTMSAGFATDSARSSKSSPPAASTRPTRRAKRSTPAPPRARISPGSSRAGPILARLILDHLLTARP